MDQLAEERRERTAQRAREERDNTDDPTLTKRRDDKNRPSENDHPKAQPRETPRATRNIGANYREIATSDVDDDGDDQDPPRLEPHNT